MSILLIIMLVPLALWLGFGILRLLMEPAVWSWLFIVISVLVIGNAIVSAG